VGASCGSAARENVIKIHNSRGIYYAYVAKSPKTGFGGEGQRLSEQLMDQRKEQVFPSFSFVGVLGAIQVGLVVVAQVQAVGVQEADPQEVQGVDRQDHQNRQVAFPVSYIISTSLKLESMQTYHSGSNSPPGPYLDFIVSKKPSSLRPRVKITQNQ
jgi:hypothetical protein